MDPTFILLAVAFAMAIPVGIAVYLLSRKNRNNQDEPK